MDVLGRFEGPKHSERHSLCEVDGKLLPLFILWCTQLFLSFSVLPALSLDRGVLHCAIVEGSFCTESFSRFIENLLDEMEPFPARNSVLVMDNCRIHKHPMIEQMIRERYYKSPLQAIADVYPRGMRCEYLPPYSPDFNPIELAFSAMKYHLRREGDYIRMAMTEMPDADIYDCLFKAIYSVSPQNARGWYRHCGYV